MGFPSTQRMITALTVGAIIGAENFPKDVRRADSIYGKPYPYLAGKTTWRDPDLPAVIKGESRSYCLGHGIQTN